MSKILPLISHPSENEIKEKLLKDHLFNVASKSRALILKTRLNLSLISKEKLAEISFIVGMLHDFGKATTFFQNYIRKNRKSGVETRHGFISALITFYALRNIGFDEKVSIFSYMIVKQHHGNLEKIKGKENELTNIEIAKRQIANIQQNYSREIEEIYVDSGIDIKRIIDSVNYDEFLSILDDAEFLLDNESMDNVEKEESVEMFFISNLLFSVLIDCDKKDAARLDNDYFQGNLEEPENDVFPYINELKDKNPEKFSENIPINQLRNQFLQEIVDNPEIKPENHFYTITAPTGIGKTFGCLGFANKLKRLLPLGEGRIIYCLPYTSIIDQNYDEFEKIIKFNKSENYEKRPSRYLLKHHHLTLGKIENRISEENYDYKAYRDDQLFVESWESSMIVTTFVQFFHTIIGWQNSFLKKFHNIVNSIVILDEVQNVNPEFYRLLERMLKALGEKFNIYFLLITATQPRILENPIEVVKSKKYMTDDLFNRVKLVRNNEYKNTDEFKVAFPEIFKGDNCLIVLNKRIPALEIYDYFSERIKSFSIFCLTTYLTPKDRNEKIQEIRQKIKNGEKIIVIATQLIEAGVDLSFKTVFRDFGPFDSIVQVAGRCNRNGEYGILGGEMHLLSLGTDKRVYKNDIRQFASDVLKSDNYRSSEFFELSKDYFSRFDFAAKSMQMLNAIYELNYDDEHVRQQIPVKKFHLIEESYASESLYVLTDKISDKEMNELKDLLKNLDSVVDEKEKSKMFLEIEKKKGFLKQYLIALHEDDLIPYLGEIEDYQSFYRYVPYSKVETVYDMNKGFRKKSQKESGVIQL